MKSHRYVLALLAPLLALQACADHRSGGATAQMERAATAIKKADDSGEFANSPDELNVAKEKYMQAKVELEGESLGSDRRARALAKRSEERADYAAAHPKMVAQADWLVPAPANFLPAEPATAPPAAAP